MNKMSAKKVKSEVKNEEIVMNKLGLSWAKLSLSWGLKLEFEVEVVTDCNCSLKFKFEKEI